MSRLVATRNSLRGSLRKSLLRPGRREQSRQKRVDRAVVEHAGRDGLRERRERFHDAAMERVAQVLQRRARRETGQRGKAAAELARTRACRKISGFSAASAPSSMNSRYICAGEMPLASAAATKPPDDTPT